MQSQRLIAMLGLLQGKRRTTARELAGALEVSMRTVYRDVEALSGAGIPVHMERGPFGGIVLDDGFRHAIAQFTAGELEAIFTAGPSPIADLGIDAQPAALRKLASALPARQRTIAQASRRRILLDQHRWSRAEQPTATLKELRAACEDERRIRLSYRDRSGAATIRNVDPLGLVAKAGVWYLIARDETSGYRTFRAERIERVERTGERFVRPADFDLERYWNESVASVQRPVEEMRVVVRVTHRIYARMGPFWSSKVERDEGERVVVRISFPSLESAIVQMIALAEDVEIIEPADLSPKIVARARAAIETFGATARPAHDP